MIINTNFEILFSMLYNLYLYIESIFGTFIYFISYSPMVTEASNVAKFPESCKFHLICMAVDGIIHHISLWIK